MLDTEALLIPLCVTTLTVQNIFTKQFNVKCPKGEYTYSALRILFALLFFIATTKNISISTEILPYSAAFSIVYTIATITSVLALKMGSLAITSLIMSYSLIIPTVYGLIFNNEELSLLKGIGISFLIVSLFLIRAEADKTENSKFSVKWLINVTVAFFTNGLCSVVQDAQQKRFSGSQNGNFMIIALFFGLVVLIIFALIFERSVIFEAIKKGTVLAAAGGICNGATNLFVMVILATVATSVFFPVLSACQLILTFIISVIFFKEKFIPRQIIGLCCGLVSLVLLNI